MFLEISVLIGISIAGGVTSSLRDTALGFSGGGQVDAVQWLHSFQPSWFPWYATEGNHLPNKMPDANGLPQWFTNGTYPGRLQPVGFHEVTETAKLENRKDGLGDSAALDSVNVAGFFKKGILAPGEDRPVWTVFVWDAMVLA